VYILHYTLSGYPNSSNIPHSMVVFDPPYSVLEMVIRHIFITYNSNCTFATNQIYVLLILHLPACFGLNKPSSGRLNHKGKQNLHYLFNCVLEAVDYFFLLDIYRLYITHIPCTRHLSISLDIIPANRMFFVTKEIYVVLLLHCPASFSCFSLCGLQRTRLISAETYRGM